MGCSQSFDLVARLSELNEATKHLDMDEETWFCEACNSGECENYNDVRSYEYKDCKYNHGYHVACLAKLYKTQGILVCPQCELYRFQETNVSIL